MERRARGTASGALFLCHGRGAWEGDLIALADVLDPDGRLHVFAPRGPLQLEDEHGFHWFELNGAGDPEPTSFARAIELFGEFVEDALERAALPAERSLLAGFSMGAAISYAIAFSQDRAMPGGLIAFSGFIPTLPGGQWQPSFDGREELPVLIVHGERDPVVDFGFAEIAMNQLSRAGLSPELRAFEGGHEIDLDCALGAAEWIGRILP